MTFCNRQAQNLLQCDAFVKNPTSREPPGTGIARQFRPAVAVGKIEFPPATVPLAPDSTAAQQTAVDGHQTRRDQRHAGEFDRVQPFAEEDDAE